jgi:hypothetical protein
MLKPPLVASPIDETCHADVTKQKKLADQADQANEIHPLIVPSPHPINFFHPSTNRAHLDLH